MTPPSPASVARAKEILSEVRHCWTSIEPDGIEEDIARALDAARREGIEAEKMCRVCLITPMECPVCVGYKRIEEVRKETALDAAETFGRELAKVAIKAEEDIACARKETWEAAAKVAERNTNVEWAIAKAIRAAAVETEAPHDEG